MQMMKSLFNSIVDQQKYKKNRSANVRIVDVVDLDLSNKDKSRRTIEEHPEWALDYRTSDEDETDNEDQLQLMRQQQEGNSEETIGDERGSKTQQRVTMLIVLFVAIMFGMIAYIQFQYGCVEKIKGVYPPTSMATEVDVANAIQAYGKDQFEKSVEQLEQSYPQPSDMNRRKKRRLRIDDNHMKLESNVRSLISFI